MHIYYNINRTENECNKGCHTEFPLIKPRIGGSGDVV